MNCPIKHDQYKMWRLYRVKLILTIRLIQPLLLLSSHKQWLMIAARAQEKLVFYLAIRTHFYSFNCSKSRFNDAFIATTYPEWLNALWYPLSKEIKLSSAVTLTPNKKYYQLISLQAVQYQDTSSIYIYSKIIKIGWFLLSEYSAVIG